MKIASLALIATLPLAFFAPQPEGEVAISARLAVSVGGEAEHRLPDGSRVDILTDDVAWEVEFSESWEEAIGQSVFYSMATNRKPGVWLLLRNNYDEDYLRCLMVCRQLGIELRTERIP